MSALFGLPDKFNLSNLLVLTSRYIVNNTRRYIDNEKEDAYHYKASFYVLRNRFRRKRNAYEHRSGKANTGKRTPDRHSAFSVIAINFLFFHNLL